MAIEVTGLGVVFDEGQVGAERFVLDEVTILLHGRLHLGIACDLQTDTLRHFKVGVLAQVLDAVDEFTGEASNLDDCSVIQHNMTVS